MNMTDTGLRGALMAQFDEFFDAVFSPLEAWKPLLQQQLQAGSEHGSITGAQLVSLVGPHALDLLEQTDLPLYGAGFCATAAVVSEGNPLAWWQGPERSLLASSSFGPGQAAIDVERLEWFRVPAETRSVHVAGPFVDYLCSNEITLTASTPVEIEGEFAGVLCADVLVSSIERLLFPFPGELDGSALVNASGRVVISSNLDFETGDRFSQHAQMTHSERYPFALAVPVTA